MKKTHFERRTKAFEQEDFDTGAMLEAGTKKVEDTGLPLAAIRLEDRDAGGDEFGYEAVANSFDEVDDEPCTCVVVSGR